MALNAQIRPIASAALAALACFAAACASAGESGDAARAAPAVKPEPPREFSFNADKVVVRDTPWGPVAVMQGNVHVVSGAQTVEAEEAVLYLSSRQIYASGSVRLADGPSEITCSELLYDIERSIGTAREAKLVMKGPDRPKGPPGPGRIERGEADLIIVRAPEILRLGPERFEAESVTITTCDFAEPHWAWSARRMELEGHRLRSYGNTLRIGPLRVFHLPVMSVALDRLSQYPSFRIDLGDSRQWGLHGLARIGFNLDADAAMKKGRPLALDDLAVDFGWRQKRGWAWGLEGTYCSALQGRGSFAGLVTGEDLTTAEDDADRAERNIERNASNPLNGVPLRAYPDSILYAARRALEGSPAPTYELEEHRGEERWGVDLVHRNRLTPDLRLDAELHLYSDRDWRYEYDPNGYYNDLDNGSFVALTHTGGLAVSSLFASARMDDFTTRTEYAPELRWSLPGAPLGGGAVLSADFSAGSLRRRFDEALNVEPHETERVRGRVELSLPLRLGPLVVRPFTGTDQAWYAEDALGEESVTRGSALYGGDVSMKFFGVLREPRPDGPGGLRHVIEPRVRYTGVSDPTHDPVSIYDFDEHDDLLGEDVVTVELINRLQTKRESPDGDIRTVDFLALGLSADYFPTADGRNDYDLGRDWDRLRSRLLVRPHEALELRAAADSDLNGRGLTRLETGFTLGMKGASALRIDYRLLEADPSRGVMGSEQIAARLDTPLHGKWRLRAAGVMEFENNASAERGAQSWSVALARDFHDWEMAVSYSVDRTGDDRLAFVNFTPKGYSRNLVRGSSEILPVAPDYSPVTDAAPEPGEW